MSLNIVDLEPVQLVPRDGWDRPLIVPRGGGKPVAHTRTTTFIDCIEDKSALSDWGKRSVLLGAALKPSLLDAVRELDPEANDYKRRLNGLAEAALEASGANDKREKGTHLHGLSEIVDAHKPLPEGISDADLMDMAAYSLSTVDMEMVHIEEFVVVPQLCVGGTPDRVVRYVGPGPLGDPVDDLFIGDLKTGTVEYGGLKIASQLACYSRGVFYDPTCFPVDVHDKKALDKWKKVIVPADEAEKAYTDLPPVNQEWGIIINLPSGSGVATLYWADLTVGWQAAEMALTIRAMRKLSKKALRPWSNAVAEAVASDVAV